MKGIYLFSAPAFSNLEIKYMGKSFYANREIIAIQSGYVSDNPSLTTLILPSIPGPIDDLLRYLYGYAIQIVESNAFFYELMSTFLDLRDSQIKEAARKFLPNKPTIEMVSLFFKSQKETNYSNPKGFRPYLRYINDYFQDYEERTISYSAVNIALEHSYPFTIASAKIVLNCLLNNLQPKNVQEKIYKETEKTIIKFIEKYSDAQLLSIVLKCPYFDISKVELFKKILSKQFFEKTYYKETGQGYFCLNPLKNNSDVSNNSSNNDFLIYTFPISIEAVFSSGTANPRNMIDFEDPKPFQMIRKEEPAFFIFFQTFTFDLQSYSIKAVSNMPYPVSWVLYASLDHRIFTEIHRCENSNIFKDNDNFVNFKVDKNIRFIRALKFVLLESSKEDGDNYEGLSTLAISLFDIYGTYHESFNWHHPNGMLYSDREIVSSDPLLDGEFETCHSTNIAVTQTVISTDSNNSYTSESSNDDSYSNSSGLT